MKNKIGLIVLVLVLLTNKTYSQKLRKQVFDDYISGICNYFLLVNDFGPVKDTVHLVFLKYKVENLTEKQRIKIVFCSDSTSAIQEEYNKEVESLIGEITTEKIKLEAFSCLIRNQCSNDYRKRKEVKNEFHNWVRYIKWYYLHSLKDFEWFYTKRR